MIAPDKMLAMEDILNMPSLVFGDPEPTEVRDYRHRAYRVWSPLCAEIAAAAAAAAEADALRAALEVIARGTSQVFDKNPQQMSGEEAKMIARAALEETKP